MMVEGKAGGEEGEEDGDGEGEEEEEEEDAWPQLRVGAFEVTGPDRAMMLDVLRTIMVRKVDGAVTTMRRMLRAKQAVKGEADQAMLCHIEAILDELGRSIRRLQ
jgi:hypothetical protein